MAVLLQQSPHRQSNWPPPSQESSSCHDQDNLQSAMRITSVTGDSEPFNYSSTYGDNHQSGAYIPDLSGLHAVDGQDEMGQHEQPFLTPVSQLDLSQLLTETRLYRCPVCDRESRSKVEFVRHYMTHSGEKPFCCAHCAYKATRKYTLLRHIKTLHPEKYYSSDLLS